MWFSAQFCGDIEIETEMPDNPTKEDIIIKFLEVMGIDMDENCGYQILDGKLKGDYFYA